MNFIPTELTHIILFSSAGIPFQFRGSIRSLWNCSWSEPVLSTTHTTGFLCELKTVPASCSYDRAYTSRLTPPSQSLLQQHLKGLQWEKEPALEQQREGRPLSPMGWTAIRSLSDCSLCNPALFHGIIVRESELDAQGPPTHRDEAGAWRELSRVYVTPYSCLPCWILEWVLSEKIFQRPIGSA